MGSTFCCGLWQSSDNVSTEPSALSLPVYTDDDNPDRRFDIRLMLLFHVWVLSSSVAENSRILKVSMSNEVERNFGGYDAGRGRLYAPEQVEIGPRDFVYVLDQRRVMVFDAFGNFIHDLAGNLFQHPTGMFADGEGVLVLDGDTLYTFDARSVRARPLISSHSVGGFEEKRSLARHVEQDSVLPYG
jgi:hypothetical protein